MHAGFAAVDITPPPGCMLDGFAARLENATGVDAPLFARAVWLDDRGMCVGGTAALIVALDLVGLEPATADAWAARLADELGLPAGNVQLTSTHTHAGPMSYPIRGLGPADAALMARVGEAVMEACRRAKAAREPARLFAGEAPASIGMNRRQKKSSGPTQLALNPEGPCDKSVHVLRCQTARQSILLFMHASHPYCIGPADLLISADFCGHAVAALEAAGHQSLYVNGCAGNIMPVAAAQGPAVTKREGERLAASVLAALPGRELVAPRLWGGSAAVALPHDTMPPMAKLESFARDSIAKTNAAEMDPRMKKRLTEALDDWIVDLRAALVPGEDRPRPVPARVSLLRIGDLALAFLPGEIFFEIGRDLVAELTAPGTSARASSAWAVGYNHGFIGYVPTPESYPDGGYEVDDAHRYLGLWRIAPTAGRTLHDAAMALAKQAT
ncbi:MAG: neutral/alkaline non-lysosomal ceramidase N-terminal domain-containing protein [Planctomycetota bacterium]|nr:neutral/alkaline non-lysosomal ceramidase N-terminal domain-containing protein [Planctomycetota bacterium]